MLVCQLLVACEYAHKVSDGEQFLENLRERAEFVSHRDPAVVYLLTRVLPDLRNPSTDLTNGSTAMESISKVDELQAAASETSIDLATSVEADVAPLQGDLHLVSMLCGPQTSSHPRSLGLLRDLRISQVIDINKVNLCDLARLPNQLQNELRRAPRSKCE